MKFAVVSTPAASVERPGWCPPRVIQPSPEGRGCTATALFPAVAGRVRGYFRRPLNLFCPAQFVPPNSPPCTFQPNASANCGAIKLTPNDRRGTGCAAVSAGTHHVAPGTNPSPVPLRLVKTPAAVHPLPSGEGCANLPWRQVLCHIHREQAGSADRRFCGPRLFLKRPFSRGDRAAPKREGGRAPARERCGCTETSNVQKRVALPGIFVLYKCAAPFSSLAFFIMYSVGCWNGAFSGIESRRF